MFAGFCFGALPGYANISPTQHYAKILDQKVSENMRLLV
ncbi:hypothetical protein EDD80_102211 [Anseongella ginsenosidimutans]|uniref:Uncharacterized protein n=1 Tax=Anseongella ginsenosidimutans TaxID=496056 RepID=A0A4R3KX09_9SPHI|nr:hypothetical protein EDD80_102211 [Anseongella ginsenosidimutans]